MQLARDLNYTLQDLFAHTTSEELGLWLCLYREEAEEARMHALLAKADAARAAHSRKRKKK
jgi:hypothetical protein